MFFDLSWSHILLFLIIALVVVGPKDLPKVMRKVGQWTAKARGMADQFRSSFDEMARQSELDELRREIESLRNANPLAETKQKFQEALTIPENAADPDTPAAAQDPKTAPSDAASDTTVSPTVSPEPAAEAAPAEAAKPETTAAEAASAGPSAGEGGVSKS